MGCDGGTIPKRDELVKTRKDPEKATKEVENSAKWNYCHLSQEVLREPIVADLLGYLYNKDALIEKHLLTKSKSGPTYVKSIKDVKELNLTVNPGFKQNQVENGNEFIDSNRSRWICPITGLEMNGVYKFYLNFSCGCVISERAIKSTASALSCLKCDKPYTSNDLIVLNPNDDDLTLNEEKYNVRKEAKAAKSASKTEKSVDASTSSSSKSSLSSVASSSSTHKRTHTQAEAIDISKKSTNVNSSDSNAKRVKNSNIQEDPNTSSVYKSLFTTSDKAKNQQKAHWVTFNPQYF